jgi:hypothetical protein
MRTKKIFVVFASALFHAALYYSEPKLDAIGDQRWIWGTSDADFIGIKN